MANRTQKASAQRRRYEQREQSILDKEKKVKSSQEIQDEEILVLVKMGYSTYDAMLIVSNRTNPKAKE